MSLAVPDAGPVVPVENTRRRRLLGRPIAWLTEPVTGWRAVRFGVKAGFAALFYSVIMSIALSHLLPAMPVNQGGEELGRLTQHPAALVLTVICVGLTEELLFRHVPLWLTFRLARNRPWIIVVVAVISSAVFGYLHGSSVFVLMQGVSGAIFAITYIKCGALQGRFFQAWMVAAVAHITVDGVAAAVIALSA